MTFDPDEPATKVAPAAPTTQLSPIQDAAVTAVLEWLRGYQRGGKQVFRLFGYAGTGKTTIAKEIARRAREQTKRSVVFAAFTGKAASVLKKKGCSPASTIHSLIYIPTTDDEERECASCGAATIAPATVTHCVCGAELPKLPPRTPGMPRFVLSGKNIAAAGLVVIDECSMVGPDLGRDLLSFGIPVLVLGDTAQLPPVGGAGFFTHGDGCEPDVLLTEIHRQAEGSGIIQVATVVRSGGRLRAGVFGEREDVEVVDSRVLSQIDPLLYDQMLVGKNATRAQWNKNLRARLGRYDPFPVEGDKLICLRNNKTAGLMNGELVTALYCAPGDDEEDDMRVVVEADDNRRIKARAKKHHFLGREGAAPWGGDELVLDYGYAITVHKSQGSQWDRVLLLDEARVFREDAARWLYTGITRAAEFLTVVR